MGFNERLLEALAKRGVRLGRDAWERIPGFNGDAASDEQLRFLNARAGKHDLDAKLKLDWVESLSSVATTLVADSIGAPTPFFSVFWIRLHGLLDELRSEHLELFRSLAIDPSTYVAQAGSPLEYALRVFRCIEAIKARFTDDELVYLDYQRQREAHPTQRTYRARWSNKEGRVLDTRTVPIIKRSMTSDELLACVSRISSQYQGDADVAVALSRRILPLLASLPDG